MEIVARTFSRRMLGKGKYNRKKSYVLVRWKYKKKIIGRGGGFKAINLKISLVVYSQM